MTARDYLFQVAPAGTQLTVTNVVSTPAGKTAALVSNGTTPSKIESATDKSVIVAPTLTYAMKAFTATGATSNLRVPMDASNDAFSFEWCYMLPTTALDPSGGTVTNPTTGTYLIGAVRNTAGGYVLKVAIDMATRRITIRDSTDAAITGMNQATAALTRDTVQRFALFGNRSTGVCEFRHYAGFTSTTQIATALTGTGNLGTTAVANLDLGMPGGTAGANIVQYFATARTVDGGTPGPIGGWVAGANVPPTVFAGSDLDVDAGTVNLSGTITDSDGTVTAASWTVTAMSGQAAPTITQGATGIGTASVTATGSFTAAPGVYRARLTGTDSASVSAFAEKFVYVAPATNADVVPFSETGAYTKVGAAATRLATITNSTVTDYLESAAAPVNDTERITWNPFGDGAITMYVSGYQNPSTPAVTVTVNVYKADGVTLIYTTSFAAPTANTETPVVLDGTAMTAIPTRPDKRALIMDVVANQ